MFAGRGGSRLNQCKQSASPSRITRLSIVEMHPFPCPTSNQPQVTELLNGMTPSAVRLDLCTRQYDETKAALLAKGWPGAADGQEPWFGFPYVQGQLPEDLLRG